MENFTNSLGWFEDACVTLDKYRAEDSRWGVISVECGALSFGPQCMRSDENYMLLYFGSHPWNDMTKIDWTTLPKTLEEAADCMNGSGYAMVKNPDPADRLHLRAG